MKKQLFTLIAFVSLTGISMAQSNPIITEWIQNHSEITGRHYIQGNSTPIIDDVLANVQSVDYSTDWVYVTATGIPSYITGPFSDGNPSSAENQNAIYRLPLIPTQNSGGATATNGGATQNWNRDAIPAEMGGFDCAKAHPAMGNYHHHQNPSAFNLDLLVVSDICDTYPADGLYVIEANTHSPLIGFAYDGFPIYGAYAYANADGSGGIVRMKSGYSLRNISTRTNGPDVGQIYSLQIGTRKIRFNNLKLIGQHIFEFGFHPNFIF